jgi:hypothetical protein
MAVPGLLEVRKRELSRAGHPWSDKLLGAG